MNWFQIIWSASMKHWLLRDITSTGTTDDGYNKNIFVDHLQVPTFLFLL